MKKLSYILSITLFFSIHYFSFGQSPGHFRIETEYDSVEIIRKKERIKRMTHYDFGGKLRRIEKINFYGNVHGRVAIFDSLGNRKNLKFRHGFSPDELKSKSSKRKRRFVYFGYGMASGLWTGDETYDKCPEYEDSVQANFGYIETHIAGCVVSRKLIKKSKRHNAGNDFIQFFRFGLNWRKRMKKKEDDCYQKNDT